MSDEGEAALCGQRFDWPMGEEKVIIYFCVRPVGHGQQHWGPGQTPQWAPMGSATTRSAGS